MAKQRSLHHRSYGLNTPEDLMDKLLYESDKISKNPHRYDLFNFFVTSAVMYEWCRQCYGHIELTKQLIEAVEQGVCESLPSEVELWIEDWSFIPNPGQDVRRHIIHALRICIETANASKHYCWLRSSRVTAIEDKPVVKTWYQHFFTPAGEGIYIEYGNQYYTVEQVRCIVVQFFRGFIAHIKDGQYLP